MAWFKVDDQLAFNAKVMLAGNSAMGLWVRAGSWSSAQLTGGFIPDHMANAMANDMAKPCDADALVIAGLWDRAEGGYQFHDWSDFQPDADAEKEKRKSTSDARSRAGRAGAKARWDSKPHGKGNGKPIANQWQANAPDPTRPDPTNMKEKKTSSPATPSKEFEEFWNSYPRKVGKGAAAKSHSKALKQASHEQIMGGVESLRIAVAGKDPQFTPHPSTWLNEMRWEDERPSASKQSVVPAAYAWANR